MVDLKALLSDAGLPVSGKKDDLIQRLLENQNTSTNEENVAPEVDAAAVEPAAEPGIELEAESEREGGDGRAAKRQRVDEGAGAMEVDGQEGQQAVEQVAEPVVAPEPPVEETDGAREGELAPPPPPPATEPTDQLPQPPPPPPTEDVPPPPVDEPSTAPIVEEPAPPAVEEESSDEEEEEVYVEDVADTKARTDLYLDTVSAGFHRNLPCSKSVAHLILSTRLSDQPSSAGL